ncbi:MAG: RNA methyltransferase [Oscillospiraceae bacterium]|nr:RNA methyltransferase [Oscillospiraceae bacterium]
MPNVIEIDDFEAPELDVYARLTEAQLLNRQEPKNAMFIAESPVVIERALDAGCVPVSMLLEKKHIETAARHVIERCKGIPVYTSTIDVLEQLTGYKLTRGVLCAMLRPAQPDVESICSKSKRIAVLENVMNPTNVGAVFRSAAALGMDAVLLTPACSDPLYRRSVRVSMGTVFQIAWAYIGKKPEDWPEPGLERLRRMGYVTAAMALRDNALSIDSPVLAEQEKLAVILGTEGDGLAESTIASCDYTVRIPMYHDVDSLNVAAASAVAFWELRHKDI